MRSNISYETNSLFPETLFEKKIQEYTDTDCQAIRKYFADVQNTIIKVTTTAELSDIHYYHIFLRNINSDIIRPAY